MRRAGPEWKREDELSSVRAHHTLADTALILGPREGSAQIYVQTHSCADNT